MCLIENIEISSYLFYVDIVYFSRMNVGNVMQRVCYGNQVKIAGKSVQDEVSMSIDWLH